MKSALDDEILISVERSARYIGNEVNAVIKDKASVDIRFCMAFPDVYEIGMSHLGIQILYDLFNKRDDTWCERVYSPWPDLAKILSERQIPLFALESQDAIKEFDFLGITLQYEMCYTNVLGLLDLSGIPLYAKDRKQEDPIVIGGGPCAYNPEPIADFFDMFYIGEGEVSYHALLDLYKSCKNENASRETFLKRASSIPGIYVPSLYTITYDKAGAILSFEPVDETVPKTVLRQVVSNLDQAVYPKKPVIPYVQATQDRAVIEIMRGCIRGCRFCQAGFVYRPMRAKQVDTLETLSKEILDETGYDELSLSSLSTSDYPALSAFLDVLIEDCQNRHVQISLPSLRIDSFSLDTMAKLSDIKKNSITFAPEAGSQRMRDVINKGITHEDIINGARMAYEAGWNKVKLYFMLGLPGEEDEDIIAIADLAQELASLYYDTVPKEKRQGKCQITVSTSFFVPKPFTPFQWEHMESEEEYVRRAHLLKDTIKKMPNQKSISYQWHAPDVTVLEGVLALGDRRLSKVIEKAYQNGATFDAWSEFFQKSVWTDAFLACQIDPNFYIMRQKSFDEILPWDFLNIGVKRSFLEKEAERSRQEKVTPNCKEQCSGCGCSGLSEFSICPKAG